AAKSDRLVPRIVMNAPGARLPELAPPVSVEALVVAVVEFAAEAPEPTVIVLPVLPGVFAVSVTTAPLDDAVTFGSPDPPFELLIFLVIPVAMLVRLSPVMTEYV